MRLADSSFREDGGTTVIDFGPGAGSAHIDGTIQGRVCVEIESRTDKQARGALMDLILHPFPKKLLILLPVHQANPVVTQRQFEVILSRFLCAKDFQVVLLAGSGYNEQLGEDVKHVLQALGCLLE
jgi:hypothetical protein